MKTIRIMMTDGSEWELPAEVVAANYAVRLTNKSEGADFEEVFRKAMEDNGTLLDHLVEEMSWGQIKEDIKQLIPSQPPDYAVLFQDALVQVHERVEEIGK